MARETAKAGMANEGGNSYYAAPAPNQVIRILLVEDEQAAAGILAKGLREEGFVVDIAADARSALKLNRKNQYGLMILDVGLPQGQDGMSLCRQVRESGGEIPILMLTARDAVEDRIGGIDAGADDYLTKPFEYGELLARLRAMLRRRAGYRESITVGDLFIDLRARKIARAGQPIELSGREYALLEYLALRAGELVTREAISEYVWDEDFNAFTNLIEVYILRLRRKIDSGHPVKLIRTRRGEGYVLSADEPGR